MKDEIGLVQILTDIKTDQRAIFSEIGEINKKFGELPCSVNSYKISLLQKIIYGGIGIILFSFVVGLVDNYKGGEIKKPVPKSAQASYSKKR